MNRNSVIDDVYLHGFGVDDAALYLDTHPQCEDALCFIRGSIASYRDAVKESGNRQTPLFQIQGADGDCWTWTDGPWPWEGGCN